MEVILKEDVRDIGKKGEIKKVKEGYAKNYLFPNKLAVEATDAEKAKIEKAKQKEAQKEEKIKQEAEKIRDFFKDKTLSLKIKVGKNGKLFGSLSSKEIAEEIKKEFDMDFDKKKIKLNTIKELGRHIAEIKLHPEVKAEVKIDVIEE